MINFYAIGMKKSLIAAAVILFAAAAALFSYPQFKKIEKRTAANPRPFDALVGKNLDDVVHTIQKIWTPKAHPESKFDHFSLAKPSDFYFPDDKQLQIYAAKDASIRQYLMLNPDLRKNDFSLTAFPDFYWPSEYYYNDQPAKFRCNFIVHLESKGSTSTKIEIFEYESQIWVGDKIGVSAHTGPIPGVFRDIRDVNPTTSDRVELLESIKKAISGNE